MEYTQGQTNSAPMKDVEGKVAFITGGNSGIGLGIARAFISAGMKVVITYRSKSHLEEAMNVLKDGADRLHAIELDVTDRSAVAFAAEETVRIFGKVHVLVNNAGIATITPLSSATFDDWDWCMSVNLNGVFNCIHAFLPYIRMHNEGGQIVSTSSMLGGIVVGPFWGIYSTSKFAVVGMMEALRSELASTNIGVSVFCPAGVKSNLGGSDRNRPESLSQSGASEPNASVLIEEFGKSMRKILDNSSESPALMDAEEAGEWVLRGIRNNDLYILSHPEYEQVIRERNEAIIASIPNDGRTLPSGRIAHADLTRTQIYINEIKRKHASKQSHSIGRLDAATD